MDEAAIRQLLDDVRSGALAPDDAVARLRRLPFADLGFARVDHHRALRQGLPEAVYGPGKTPEQCAAIVAELLAEPGGPVVFTRADDAQAGAALATNPGGRRVAGTVTWRHALPRPGNVLVVTAGTADLPVAEECAAVLTAYGLVPTRVSDAGVAGVHRLLVSADELQVADVVVVIAGMEGALASLVGGITPAPVVAVPTSVGYGASLEGVTALLAMLASCAAGITVVGIDNGYGAACAVLPVAAVITTAWFHCFAGIAGDMALGSLVDAGADLDEVRELLERLPLRGWSLEAEPVLRGGVAATRVIVSETDRMLVVRTYAHISGLISEARLPERVQERAERTFKALAEVEGRLHRRPPGQVHFHEVGGVDAIIDVVGTCAALEVLGVDEVQASPVATGIGMVRTAHGMLPNPAPAVVELLRGVPLYGRDVAIELTTPTGAALLAASAIRYGALPAMTVTATGFGAGSREVEGLPNVTQVVIGTSEAVAARPRPGQPVVLLEVNVDDVTGETLAHAVAALLEAGAHDAWITPVVMKKGRPAYTVSALTDPALAEQVASVLTAETGSFGIRGSTLERWPASRREDQVDVLGVPVRVKVSAGRAKVEHDDAVRAARVTGLPLREVVSLAEAVWRTGRAGRTDEGDDEPPPLSAG